MAVAEQLEEPDIAQAIKTFGAKGIVVSSDLGQSANITTRPLSARSFWSAAPAATRVRP